MPNLKSEEVSVELWNRVSPTIEGMKTFKQRKDFIDTHKYLPRLIEKYPEFKEKINTFLLDTVVSEFGNPEDPGYSFSREYSDKFLLERLDLIEKNKAVYEDYFGGKTGVEQLEEKLKSRNTKYKEAGEKVSDLQEAILRRRREFDDRSKSFGGPAGVFEVPLQTMKPVVQFFAGWTDLFQPQGLEQVENRKFDWDPVNKRYGPGPEIPELQERLREAYEEKNDTVPQQYYEESEKYEEYKDMMESDQHNKAIINATGVDEALKFLSLESLKSTLQR
jgi:hypothetical protein